MRISKLTLLLCLSMSITLLNGQKRQHVIDSLKNVYQTADADFQKASSLIMLGDLYYSFDTDSAFVFLELGKQIADKIEDQTLVARYFLIKGSVYWAKEAYLEALKNTLLAQEIYQKLEDNAGLTRCYMNIGYLNYDLGNYNEAMEFTQKGLGLEESMAAPDSVRMASFYQNLGLFSEKEEDYPQALDYYLKSLKIKEQSNKIDKRTIPNTLDGIAGVYNFMEQYDSALTFYEKGLKMREELNDQRGMFGSTYNLGVVYQGLERFEAAREYYNKGLLIADRLNSLGYAAYCYDALGDLEKKVGNYPESVALIHKSLEIRKKRPETTTYTHSLTNMSGTYKKWSKPLEALKYAKIFEGVYTFANLEDQAEMRNIQSEVWENLGQLEKSLGYLRMANVLEDSLAKRAAKQHLDEVKVRSEKELKRERFEKKIFKKDAELKAKDIQFGRQLLWLLSIAFIIFAILFILLAKAARERKLANIDLAKNYDEIRDVNRKLGVASNSLKQFTFAASHDLKESLRSVISFSQVLIAKVKKDDQSEDTKTKIGFIVESGKRMHKTLDDLLKYADINLPKEGVKVVDFPKIIEEVKAQIFKKDNIELKWPCDEGIGELQGYPSLLKQLMVNLLDNASKFASDEKSLKISIVGQRKEGNKCLIAVKDNGKGIENDYLDYIFQPFKRLNNRDLSGSGLGLSVCKKIVEIHGGEIWAESVLGEGTTIYFTIISK